MQNLDRHSLQNFLAVGVVHEQLDNLRVGEEGAAVRVVGTQRDAPRILHQQIPFQTDGPLQCVDKALLFIGNGHDTAAGFHFRVGIGPFMAGDFMEVVA